MKKDLYIKIAVVVLFCIFSPLQVEGWDLYKGKSSVVFKENSSEIADTTVLESSVAELSREKGTVNINIVLMCAEIVQPGAKETDLANKRVEVLKSYFQQRLPGAVIITSGKTVSFSADQLEIYERIAVQGPDMLMIQGSLVAQQEESTGESAEQGEKLEHWQLVLLDKYKKIEEKHSFLCSQERHTTQYEKDEECDPATQTDLSFHLCLLKGHTIASRIFLDDHIEYDLDRMLQIRETSGEIVAISREITKHTPEAGSFSYDPLLLDEEIDRQLLAIKHYNRAFKKINRGLKHLPKIGDGDPNDFQIREVYKTYKLWFSHDTSYGLLISFLHRKEIIHHVMKLHNFVRKNIGLGRLTDTRFSPICVHTEIMLTENCTFKKLDENYETFVRPYLLDEGIPDDIPLE